MGNEPAARARTPLLALRGRKERVITSECDGLRPTEYSDSALAAGGAAARRGRDERWAVARWLPGPAGGGSVCGVGAAAWADGVGGVPAGVAACAGRGGCVSSDVSGAGAQG